MFELTINGNVYQFEFGMGFVKEIDKTASTDVMGLPGVKQNVGLSLAISKITDGDVVALSDALFRANKGFNPRVTPQLIDAYIDSEDTDIDELFDKVIGFFEKSNATRKAALQVKKNLADAAELMKNLN